MPLDRGLFLRSGQFRPAPEGTAPRCRPGDAVVLHALRQGDPEDQAAGASV